MKKGMACGETWTGGFDGAVVEMTTCFKGQQEEPVRQIFVHGMMGEERVNRTLDVPEEVAEDVDVEALITATLVMAKDWTGLR